MSVLYLYALVGDPPAERPGPRAPPGAPGGPAGPGIPRGRGPDGDAAPAASPDTLRRHDAIVRRIAATVDAILPMRFGSVAPDEDAAARLLAPRAIELAGRLAQVRGHEQMTLRVFGPRAASRPRAPAAGTPAGARLGPGSALPRRAQAPP